MKTADHISLADAHCQAYGYLSGCVDVVLGNFDKSKNPTVKQILARLEDAQKNADEMIKDPVGWQKRFDERFP